VANKQKTIKKEFSLKGVGLHTENEVHLGLTSSERCTNQILFSAPSVAGRCGLSALLASPKSLFTPDAVNLLINCVLVIQHQANPGAERLAAYLELTFNEFASEQA